MGLFTKFRKVNKQQTEDVSREAVQNGRDNEIKRPAKLGTKAERLDIIKDSCEQITENTRQLEEAKVEYEAVTSYLTDMQRIDMIPKEQRENMEDAARKIINLNKEREKYRQKNTSITDSQYRLYESYEDQIPKELGTIKESENYQKLIQNDIEQLEGEKKSLIKEEKEIINKQSFLKGIAIMTSVVVILLFIIFAALAAGMKVNLTWPFLLTVLMGMGTTVYIVTEARKNLHEIKLVELKQNRQIVLMNKVKIKSVNNRSYLDYTYSKYMVENYEQLKNLWDEYMKIKDETRRYQNNTELLEFYNNELVSDLRKFGIKDSEIWIYQPEAILDSKEMVEIRHRLNVRRQKLRERIDANNKQNEEAVKTITSVVKAYPDCKEEAVQLLKRYKLKPEI